MNEYEKAYKQLYRMITNDYSMGSRIINDFEPLKELVERATPKKVELIEDNEFRNRPTFETVCPNCSEFVNEYSDKYCSSCGQRLEWGDEE